MNLCLVPRLACAVTFLMWACTSVTAFEAQPARQQLRVQQNQFWASLDRETRTLLVERAKYVLRINHDLIIDAYPLMRWRDQLDSLVERHSVQTISDRGFYRKKTTVGYEWKYREREEIAAEFELPTYGALYWYGGVLVNDRELWDSQGYAHVLTQAGVTGAHSSKDKALISEWISSSFPRVVVIDPLSQKDRDTDTYQLRNGSVYLRRGAVGSALGFQARLPTPSDGEIHKWPGDLAEQFRYNSARLPEIVGQNLKDGIPAEKLGHYLLFPLRSVSGGVAVGPASRSPSLLFEIHEFRKYQVDPKELAWLWKNGELEIPHRVVKRVGSSFSCTEHLLQRP